MPLGSVVAIGARAAAVLRQGREARVLAPLRASIYIVLRGEVLWLGAPDQSLHPRAILLSKPPPGSACMGGEAIVVPSWTVPPWSPEPLSIDAGAAAALRRGAARLAAAAATFGSAVGFGARLVGAPLAFPLTSASRYADSLAAACAIDDPAAAATAAVGLLGLGSGLTPSGDDFVGGAFFARASLAGAGAGDVAGWHAAAGMVRDAAMRLTHPISAALLGDLLEGEGWAALHDLARALAREDDAAAHDAARRLIALGHSSGWDVLAGFVAGAAR